MIARKLNIEARYTDLYEEALGKKFRVKSDHKTILILNELLAKGEDDENGLSNDEKVLKLLLGETAFEEIKAYLDANEGYSENVAIAVFDALSIAQNVPFEEYVKRFRKGGR